MDPLSAWLLFVLLGKLIGRAYERAAFHRFMLRALGRDFRA